MCKELVSIIVPVYNSLHWFQKCIYSLVNQSYQNIEIIIVDDGSEEKVRNICDRYVYHDDRIKVIHQQNAGVASARNNGLGVAKGKYITFVDSDDWLDIFALETMLNSLKKNEADICVGAYLNIGPLKANNWNSRSDYCGYLIENDAYFNFLKVIHRGPWGKLYKREIIQENHISFPDGVKYGEDTIFLAEYLTFCNKVSYVSKIVYYYNCTRSDSASKMYYSEINGWVLGCLKSILRIFEKKNALYTQTAVAHFTVTYFWLACNVIVRGLNKPEAVTKLEETFLMFQENVSDVDINSIDDEHLKNLFNQYLACGDIEGVYNYINSQNLKSNKKSISKKIFSAIRCTYLWLFKRSLTTSSKHQ